MPDSRIRKLSRNFSRSISRSSSDSWIPLTRHSTYSLPSLAQSDEIPTHSPASRPARHDPLEPAYLPPFSKYSTSRSPPKPAYDFSAPLTSNPLSGFSGITLTVPPPTYHRQSQHGALIDPEWEFHLQDGPHTIKHGHDPTFLSSDTNASNYKIAGGSSYGSEVPRSTSTGPSSPKQGSIIHPDDQPDLIDDDDDEDEPQDSTQAWLHSVTAFFTVLNGWGLPSTFGIYQSYYTFAPDLPKSLTTSSLQSLAWIGSTQLGLSFLMGLPMGYAVDKGHLSPAFKLSSLVLALSVLSTSLCRSYTSLFFVQGVLTGLGCGGVVGSGLPVLSSWFSPRNRAKGMALAAAGSCIGTAMYAVIARECLRRYGFEITFRVIGTVVAITLLPACCVFRYRRVVKRDERQYVLFRRSGPDETKDKPWWANVQKDYVFAMAGMFCAFLGLYFGFVYIVAYARDTQGVSADQAVNLLVYMSVSNLAGRVFPALISDRCIGPINTIIPCAVQSAGVAWLWTAVSAAPHLPGATLVVIACFYGFSVAGIQVLYPPVAYSLSGVYGDEQQQGTKFVGLKAGGITTVIGLGSLFGAPIGGALIEHRTSRGLKDPYLGAELFAATTLTLGAVLLLAARVAKSGWKAQRV